MLYVKFSTFFFFCLVVRASFYNREKNYVSLHVPVCKKEMEAVGKLLTIKNGFSSCQT